MDANHFDSVVHALTAEASRRGALTGVLGGVLMTIGAWPMADVAAKKRKKKKKKKVTCNQSEVTCGKKCCPAGQSCLKGVCVGPCEFTKTNELWTLLASCVTTETIVVPDGVALDGDGKTIHLAGPVADYQSLMSAGQLLRAGFLIQNGSGKVRNLTIDQDPLECQAGLVMTAILIQDANGEVQSVTMAPSQTNFNCYRGVNVASTGGNKTIDIRDVEISGIDFSGISITGPISGGIRHSSVSNRTFGVVANSGVNLEIEDNAFLSVDVGITVGGSGAAINALNNTFVGELGATDFAGVVFSQGGGGGVSANTISNFTCGIRVDESAGVVLIGTKDFSVPPANGQDVCLPDP